MTAPVRAALLAVLVAGCDGGSPAPPDAAVDSPQDVDSGQPVRPPVLGPQLDRAGRSGIAVWTAGAFEADPARNAARDAYNEAALDAWGAQATVISASLAMYDAADQTCGNQFLAGPAPDPSRYRALAEMLADDQLYVDTAAEQCNAYLGVELHLSGIMSSPDCGGRTPLDDAVRTMYWLLVPGPTGGRLDDGLTMDADGEPSLDRFPWLADPV